MQNFNTLANLISASFQDVENLERQAVSFRNIICGILTDLGVDSFELSFNTVADGSVTNLNIASTDKGITVSITKPEDIVEDEGNDVDVN